MKVLDLNWDLKNKNCLKIKLEKGALKKKGTKNTLH